MSFAFSLCRINNTILRGVRGQQFDRRENVSSLSDDGTLHQTSHAVIRTAPQATFSTVAVRTLVGISGMVSNQIPFVALATTGLEMIGNKLSSTVPGYDATAVHARRQFTTGGLVLDGLGWSSGSILEANCSAYGLSADGTTDPVVSDTVALPTVPQNTEQLVLSALTVAGTPVGPARLSDFSVSIANKIANDADPGSYHAGLPHPTMLVGIGAFGPSEISGSFSTLDLTASIATSGAIVASFRLLNHLGVGIGATGIDVTINASMIREGAVQGGSGGPGRRTFNFRGSFDGTNRPLTLAVI